MQEMQHHRAVQGPAIPELLPLRRTTPMEQVGRGWRHGLSMQEMQHHRAVQGPAILELLPLRRTTSMEQVGRGWRHGLSMQEMQHHRAVQGPAILELLPLRRTTPMEQVGRGWRHGLPMQEMQHHRAVEGPAIPEQLPFRRTTPMDPSNPIGSSFALKGYTPAFWIQSAHNPHVRFPMPRGLRGLGVSDASGHRIWRARKTAVATPAVWTTEFGPAPAFLASKGRSSPLVIRRGRVVWIARCATRWAGWPAGIARTT